MHSVECHSAVSPPTYEAPNLRGVLEELDITPFIPESVAHYKRERLAGAMEEVQCRRKLMQEITPGYWERQIFRRLQPDEAFQNPDGDDPLVEFFDLGLARIAVYARWEKKPLTEALGVPDHVKTIAAEIASYLERAWFRARTHLRIANEQIFHPTSNIMVLTTGLIEGESSKEGEPNAT